MPTEQILTRAADLDEFCVHLASCPVFGFDTEFVGEDAYQPFLCLVQVATSERLVLIDPFTAGPLDAFWQCVSNPAHLVVVHGGREEVRLCQRFTGKPPGKLVDLQYAAALVGLTYPLGQAALVQQVLGIQLAKGETLTEWRHRPLTPQQVQYAYDDVRYLLPVWHALAERLERLQRHDWLREEMDRLVSNALRDEAVVEKWRKLRGLGSLDRRRLAVVKALHDWREELAARTNRPPRTIVRDDLLIEIARRNPTRERELQAVRGLPRRDLSAILAILERVRQLPADQLPRAPERDNDPSQVNLVTNLLTAFLGDWSARNRVASNLVANTHDVRLLVRARLRQAPLPQDSLLTSGWRAQHVLPDLLSILEGRCTMRVADLRSEAPFAFDVDPA